MLEILVTFVVAGILLILAARRRGGVRPAVISASLPLLTLANLDVLGEVFPDTVDKPTFAVSMDGIWSLINATVTEGPIQVGIAHSDYTDAEIEEWIENQGSWGTSDLVGQEVSRRKIRSVGEYDVAATDEVLNDGKPIRTRIGFMLNTGDTLKYWAYNRSGLTLTTGASVSLAGTIWLRK